MRKMLSSLLVILVIFISVSFLKPNIDTSNINETTENKSESTTVSETQNPELSNISIVKTADWKTKGLETLGLYEVEISEPESCEFGSVYTLSKTMGDGAYSSVYLAVETSDTVWITYTTDSYSASVVLNDIDGEQGEEIVLNQTVGLAGGAGSHNSSIWKITEKGIEQIFDSYYFDSGFESYLEEPFKLVISNKNTGYETTLDYKGKNEYIGTIFSESGKPIDKYYPAMIDSYYEFNPIDVDGDGVFEIKCKQYTSLYSHVDYIGDAEITIRYNSDKNEFKIIEAGFTPCSD